MQNPVAESESAEIKSNLNKTVYPVLFAISLSHMLNDILQSLIPAIYPLIKESFHLTFAQVGLITLTFQLSASLLQPVVGTYTDLRPKPYSLAIGMSFTLVGLLLLSISGVYAFVLCSVALIGIGSSVFHPEASRVAYLASGGKRGTAQSIFQVGGNAGSALGPLLAALIIVPFGKSNIAWFSLLALGAIIILYKVGSWYKEHALDRKKNQHVLLHNAAADIPKWKIITSVFILLILIFSKFFYMASLSSYYTFFLIDKFHLSIQSSQLYLFIFLAAVAAGTILGGPLGDRFGRKYIIWFSILGASPFSLLLPHAGLVWTAVLSVFIGVTLASAFPAILVYAQELLPGKIGMITGLFFGFAFGMGGIGSALLGNLADHTSINYVFQVCAFLPLIGLLTGFLPNIEKKAKT